MDQNIKKLINTYNKSDKKVIKENQELYIDIVNLNYK